MPSILDRCLSDKGDAARELPWMSLEERTPARLYAEHESPKFQPAARQWLIRYLSEGTPSLKDVAKVTARLAELR